jgi:BirA family transcriptional regulator, biotin operon repressor / biotin---[acetyl-CoA-carboxylase] ligase
VSDSLEPDAVRPLLRGRFGRDYRYAERTPSTQRLLEDAAEGAVAVAEEQTEGRGRLGRSWHARPGTSVLVSVLLEPPVRSERLPELTPLAGEACADAIAAVTGLAPTIKPPNDVLVDGRKVAGILVEARPREGWAVLGMGINVALDVAGLPPELRAGAGTLGRSPGELDAALAELLDHLGARLAEPATAALDALRARDALHGRAVTWAGGTGVGAGIDGDGALLVRTPAGTLVALDAGEVHLGR